MKDGRSIAILGFHKIGKPAPGGWESWYYVSEARFVGFLESIAEEDRPVIGLDALLRGLDDPSTVADGSVVLTFDDGYRSVHDVALPRLREFGYPAVLFVPTDFIGDWNRFDADREPRESMCTWDELRELDAQGVSVQSHGASHRSFSDLTAGELRDEVTKSRHLLEAGLQTPVRALAYPYGDAGAGESDVPRILAEAGYRAGFLYARGRSIWPPADPFRIERIAVGPETDVRAWVRAPGTTETVSL